MIVQRVTRVFRSPRGAAIVALLLLISGWCGACSQSPEWMATARRAMVATDHPLASRVGADVLKRGGNAVDAAVAVSFALGVTRPYSTGLGGGGFMIVRLADGRAFAFDYRERAPLAATADMFDRAAKSDPDGPPPSQYGYLAAGTPGLLAGMKTVHDQFGQLPFEQLIEPAIKLAEHGFAIDENYAKEAAAKNDVFERYPVLKQSCNYVYETHLRGGDSPSAGDRLRQPKLARLLRGIRRGGLDFFYRGEFAEALTRTMQQRGGIITGQDLAGYEVTLRKPIQATYRGYDILTMPPPSSGGACLVEALNILETVDLPRIWRRDPDLARHYLIEAMKHAFADRARWMADADFAPVPIDLLTSKAYAQQLALAIDPNETQPIDTYGAVQIPEDAGTSHYSIIDAVGNCVVGTETINTVFGSLAAVDEWGLILNNQMDDFAAHSAKANYYGLIQSDRNVPEPLKRPLSSMTPTIILQDGQPLLLIGGSGGPRIISSVLNMTLNLLDFGMSPREAMTAVRIHHQWRPEAVVFGKTPPAGMASALEARGHVISDRRSTGVAQLVWVKSNRMIGVSDPRKGGAPAGY